MVSKGLLIVVCLAALAAWAGVFTWRRISQPRADFQPIQKFDVHTHLSPGGLPQAVTLFDANGITRAVNLSGGETPARLREQLLAASRAHDRILVFANLDFRHALEPGWVERQAAWLAEAHRMGARGLKIFKTLGLRIRDPSGALVPVDDHRLDPIFEAAGHLGMPVAIHVGDPKAFFEPLSPRNERIEELSLNPAWSYADRSSFPAWETLFEEFERLVARHPGTRFIGVHFGNDPEEPERVAALLDRCPNLSIDTAARVGEIGRFPAARLRALFIDHRSRILFGTDVGISSDRLTLGAPEPYPETASTARSFYEAHWRFFETAERGLEPPSPIQGAWRVDGLALPKEVLVDLYHGNADRLFGP